MTKRQILTVLFSLIVVLSVSSVYAGSVVKIGFVDQQQVFEKSKMGLNFQGQIKAMQTSKQGQIDTMQKELEELDKKIKNQDLPINEQQREELKKEKRKKEIDLKYFVDDAYEQGNQMSSKLMKKFDEKVKEIVKKVGEADGYSLVIEKTGIIFYGNSEFDLTEKVITELNKIPE
jgi:outer membrane protein